MRALAADLERHDRVGVAVDDERRHVHLRHVAAEVGAAERGDAVERALGRGEGGDVAAVAAERLADQRRDLRLQPGGEEVLREVVQEREAVASHARLELRDRRVVQPAVGVVGRLVQVRRDRRRKHRPGDPLGAVPADVADDLAAAHREADERHVPQVEVLDQRVQVGGERVVVVPVPRLARPTEAPAVVGDHAVACIDQCRHLMFPRPPAQRPPVDQDDRLPLPVVLVVELDLRAVLVPDRNLGHDRTSGRIGAGCLPALQVRRASGGGQRGGLRLWRTARR